MQRLCVYSAFGCVLFALGLTAGRSITDGATLVDVASDSADISQRSAACRLPGCSAEAVELTHDPEMTREFRTTASLPTLKDIRPNNHHDHESFAATLASQTDVTQASSSVEFAADSRDSAPVESTETVSRDDLIKLIRRMIPAADEATVVVWADSYSGMDLADVEFILEQKRRHDSPLTTNSVLSTETSVRAPDATGSTMGTLERAIESNLREAMTIGYRRMTVLTEPGSLLPSAEQCNSTVCPNVVSFRCFDKGRIVSSPVATHVSIASDSSSEMFLLENHQLTRRGDFRRLSDGTFGLLIAGQEFRLAESPAHIETSAVLQINESGEILSSVNGAIPKTLSRILVVRAANCSALTTMDGVVFQDPSNDSLSPVDMVRLAPGTLEISNVNIEEESRLRHIVESADSDSALHD